MHFGPQGWHGRPRQCLFAQNARARTESRFQIQPLVSNLMEPGWAKTKQNKNKMPFL